MQVKNVPVEMVTGTDFHLLTLGINCPENTMTPDLLMMVLCMHLVAVSMNYLLH